MYNIMVQLCNSVRGLALVGAAAGLSAVSLVWGSSRSHGQL